MSGYTPLESNKSIKQIYSEHAKSLRANPDHQEKLKTFTKELKKRTLTALNDLEEAQALLQTEYSAEDKQRQIEILEIIRTIVDPKKGKPGFAANLIAYGTCLGTVGIAYGVNSAHAAKDKYGILTAILAALSSASENVVLMAEETKYELVSLGNRAKETYENIRTSNMIPFDFVHWLSNISLTFLILQASIPSGVTLASGFVKACTQLLPQASPMGQHILNLILKLEPAINVVNIFFLTKALFITCRRALDRFGLTGGDAGASEKWREFLEIIDKDSPCALSRFSEDEFARLKALLLPLENAEDAEDAEGEIKSSQALKIAIKKILNPGLFLFGNLKLTHEEIEALSLFLQSQNEYAQELSGKLQRESGASDEEKTLSQKARDSFNKALKEDLIAAGIKTQDEDLIKASLKDGWASSRKVVEEILASLKPKFLSGPWIYANRWNFLTYAVSNLLMLSYVFTTSSSITALYKEKGKDWMDYILILPLIMPTALLNSWVALGLNSLTQYPLFIPLINRALGSLVGLAKDIFLNAKNLPLSEYVQYTAKSAVILGFFFMTTFNLMQVSESGVPGEDYGSPQFMRAMLDLLQPCAYVVNACTYLVMRAAIDKFSNLASSCFSKCFSSCETRTHVAWARPPRIKAPISINHSGPGISMPNAANLPLPNNRTPSPPMMMREAGSSPFSSPDLVSIRAGESIATGVTP